MTTEAPTWLGDESQSAAFGCVFKFHEVFRGEVALINERRTANEDPRGTINLETEAQEDTTGEEVLRPAEEAAVVGLALSGGGIRSAAFCLGALQAMDATDVLKRVDYLSTVSGGGYIGCSLTAALEATGGEFPFTSRPKEDETPSMQHLRDHSNYLFSNGAVDLLHNASIYVRGLVANAVVVLPFLLVASAITLFSLTMAQGKANVFGFKVWNILGYDSFVVTTYLALLLPIVAIAWGIYRSGGKQQREAEIPSGPVKYFGLFVPARFIGALVIVILFSAVCEIQSFVLRAMLDPYAMGFFGFVSNSINKAMAFFAPFAAVIAFFGSKLGEFVKSATEKSGGGAKIARYATKAAIYFAALVVPLLLWVIFLDITFWGICINEVERTCGHPDWLERSSRYLFGADAGQPATLFYLAFGTLFLGLTLFLRPNANSLHPLYRDHLSKAFLFRPQDELAKSDELGEFRPRLSGLTSAHGPYHLINTALNIQNSRTANKRGRNADFFVLSQKFVGSKTTGYVATRDMEELVPGLDLATAMAVSGAAASSNMGAESIKPLTPTLALLNIRLGYWLRNPQNVWKRGGRNLLANFYFLLEMFGLLNENRKSVYLTDGGHIENLGIYELFKRRCRIIIAVDAEADPEMAFGSLNTMERYALIDLGVRIELPWQKITNESLATSKAIDETGDAPPDHGPHCAIGEITYPDQRKGILIYIKSSLTGDENDFVYHYKKRYDTFPHETTLDQFFSEEQFEAYRALGFHAAFGLFDRSDAFAHHDPATCPEVRKNLALLDQLFPHVSAGGNSNQSRATFEAWLTAAKKAALPKRKAPGHSEQA